MSISYGSWTTADSYGNKFRAGSDITYAKPTVNTSSVKVTVKFIVQVKYAASGGNDGWTVSGDVSGSGTKSWNTSRDYQTVTFATFTKTVSISRDSTTKFYVKFTATNLGGGNKSAMHYRTVNLPKRPINSPSSPNGLSAQYPFQNNRPVIKWNNNSTSNAPYSSIEVQRRVRTRGSYGSWSRVATLSGSATSWVDSSATALDSRYAYAVRAVNAAGSSSWDYGFTLSSGWPSNTVMTTPLIPDAPTATKNSSGNVVVTRPDLSYEAEFWRARAYSDSGLAGVESDDLPASQSTWTHTGPDTSSGWSYRVRAGNTHPAQLSAWSEPSATVALESPPYAASDVAVDGGATAVDASVSHEVTWTHNPSDTTPQRKAEVSYRDAGEGAFTPWTTATVTGSASAWTVPAGTWKNGGRVEFRVRTWGAHSDPGPWSDVQSVRTSESPAVAVVGKVDPLTTSTIKINWTYSDSQNSSQNQYSVTLWDTTSGDLVELESRLFTGSATSYTFRAPAENGHSYKARVRASNSLGVWSDWGYWNFSVSYAPPPIPILHPRWDRGTSTVYLGTEVPEPRTEAVPEKILATNYAHDPFLTHTPVGSEMSGVVSTVCEAPVTVVDGVKWIAIASTYSRPGSGYLDFESNPTNSSWVGKSVYLTATVKVTQEALNGGAQPNLVILYRAVEGGSLQSISSESPKEPGTYELYVTADVPDIPGQTVYIRAYHNAAAGNLPLYYRDFYLSDTPSDVFSGDTEPEGDTHYRWTGTPGASASEAYEPALPVEVPAVAVDVYRADETGRPAELVAEGASPGAVVEDHYAPFGTARYVAVAVSATPSQRMGRMVEVATRSSHMVIMWPGGIVRLWANLSADFNTSRSRETHHFDGATKPALFVGSAVSRSASVKANIYAPWVYDRNGSSDWRDIDDLAAYDGPVHVRFPTGEVFLASVDSCQISGKGQGAMDVDISLTEVVP